MTLQEAKDAAAKESRVQKGKTFFVVVDADGEADLSSKAKKDATVAAYKGGNEIPFQQPDGKKEAPVEKKATKAKAAPKDASNQNNEDVKNNKKTTGRKPAKKAAKSATLPEGKKKTLTVGEALKLAKKGARIFRASNGSDLGEYYLVKYKDKEKKLDLIVREA